MNQKQQELMEASMQLFAQKGFHATSVQNIVDAAGISKGAFYNYFRSKEELIVSIFKYYYRQIRLAIDRAVTDQQSPAENFRAQMVVLFKELFKHKGFISMQRHDPEACVLRDLQPFIERAQLLQIKWYMDNFSAMYGEEAAAYYGDLIATAEGLFTSYLKIALIDNMPLSAEEIAHFIIRRLDDIVNEMKAKKYSPIYKAEQFQIYVERLAQTRQGSKSEINQILVQMGTLIDGLDRSGEEKQELQHVVALLLDECKKKNPEKLVLQGLLAHLKGIKSLLPLCKKIAAILNIRLL